MTYLAQFFGFVRHPDLPARLARERAANIARLAALLDEIADPAQRTASAQ